MYFIIIIIFKLATGYGYQNLGTEFTTMKIDSSKSSLTPTTINGKDLPFHFELLEDIDVSQKFIEFKLPSQIVISGLEFTTIKSNSLKRFRFYYSDKEVLHPDQMTTFMETDDETPIVSTI